jgi:hypothetical protein
MDVLAERVASRGACAVVLICVLSIAACKGATPPTEAPAPLEGYDVSLTGYVSKTYDADLDAGVASVKAALATLQFHVLQESGALFEKTFEIESEDGTSVVVKVAAVTKSTTRISVKVGYLFGNQDAARRIHSEIEAEIAGHRQESKDKARRWGRSVGADPIARPSPSPAPPPNDARATTRPR